MVEITLQARGIGVSVGNVHQLVRFADLQVGGSGGFGPVLGSSRCLGIIGKVDFGPGYVVLVEQGQLVADVRGVQVFRVAKIRTIPLKFELAKQSFSYCGGSSGGDAGDGDSGDGAVPCGGGAAAAAPAAASMPECDGDSGKQADVFFSKLGVYVQDFKSNPSLSLAKKLIFKSDSDLKSESGTSESDNDNESDSIKLNRSITIKKKKTRESKSIDYDNDKFLKQLKDFFESKDFYYSPDADLTGNLFMGDNDENDNDDNDNDSSELQQHGKGDSFFYNKFISKDFSPVLRIKLIQGFIDLIDLPLKSAKGNETAGKMLLVSKRSYKRSGSRYLRRGINDLGQVANFVETSQYLIINNTITRFDIIRGSIPLFFKQNPADLKPIPTLTRDLEHCQQPFLKHFDNLKATFKDVTCISLVERSPKEVDLGKAFEDLAHKNNINFSWFDFHDICKKMKFSRVDEILHNNITPGNVSVLSQLLHYGWYDSVSNTEQKGVFRINCIDCLDRTNLVSKFLSEFILTQILSSMELKYEAEFSLKFNHMWADNGDAISRQYASTNALKGDFTRNNKRNYKGLINDALLTMSRYYSGYVKDYYKQCFIDFIIGEKGIEVFDEFNSSLNNFDPNDINFKKNLKDIELKICCDQLDLTPGEIVVDSFYVSSPFQFNKLKINTLNYSELLVNDIKCIISNKFIYLVKDESKQLKLNISEIKEIQYGTYILSTHSNLSVNAQKNIGIKFILENDDFLTIKFPLEMDYSRVKFIIELISKTCFSSHLCQIDICTEQDVKNNVVQILEHRFKKFVWG